MTPRRTTEIRTPIRALLTAAGLGAGLSLSAPAPTAAADEGLLEPTPLILKDGRIANVSVHVLAFPAGQSVLGPVNSRNLESLSAELATDCFLTAQVIGHVGATEAGNDTLGAHRLARARADAVQASLIADGLPAKAIASVWDWQFMVRAPRATLWVFRLTPGEDCEGTPVDPGLVAEAEPQASEPPPVVTPASQPRPVPPPREVLAEQVASASEGRPDQASPAPVEPPPAPAAIVRSAQASTAPVAVPAGASRPPAEVPSVIQALPAVSPKPAQAATSEPEALPDRQPETRVAALEPEPRPEPQAERQPGGDQPGPAERVPVVRQAPEVVGALPERPAAPRAEAATAAAQEELVIIFPTNSSYFPPGTGGQLEALVRRLAGDRRYEVILQASVSGSPKVIGAESADEAAQYNQWLAERRADRVRDWLEQNADAGGMVIKRDYRADDESREVVVRVVPTG